MNAKASTAIFWLAQFVITIVMSVAVKATPTNMIQMSLAYRQAAIEEMLKESTFHVARLGLPTPNPIRPENLRGDLFVTPPRMGFGGVLMTTNFVFVIHNHLKLNQIRRRDIQTEHFDKYPIWAKTPSLVNSNGAYQLATQWLRAIDVDVSALEKKHKLSFYQWFYWGREAGVPNSEWNQHPPTTNKVMLPIYDVRWGEGSSPPVKLTVFGPTRELVVLELNDISFSRRPPNVISNWQELLNIPDPPKKQLQVPVQGASSVEINAVRTTRSNHPPPFKRRIVSGEP